MRQAQVLPLQTLPWLLPHKYFANLLYAAAGESPAAVLYFDLLEDI
jgi:hypothetical protein